MVCGMIYDMCALVWYYGCFLNCGLFYGMLAVVLYMGFCMLYILLYGFWASEGCVVCLIMCEIIYDMWLVCAKWSGILKYMWIVV